MTAGLLATVTGPVATAGATTPPTPTTTAAPTTTPTTAATTTTPTTAAPTTTPTTAATTTTPTTAAPTTTSTTSVSGPVPAGMAASAAYILVDAQTGRILAQMNDQVAMSPASLSKMFTALVAAGWLPASTTITASAADAALEPNRIGMMPGQAWPLNEVLQALLVISANDAAYAIAEKVAGTVPQFGAVVDQAMTEMGITDNPVFHDPAGLDDTMSIDGGNLICARDLAIAARDLLADPILSPIVAQQNLNFTGPQGTVYGLANVNDTFLKGYPGAIGIKTGLTDKSGFSVAEAATRNGRTLIAIVLHGANSYQSAMQLLDQGFATPVAAEGPQDALPSVLLPTPAVTVPATTSTTSPPTTAPGPVSLGPARPASLSTSGSGDSPMVLWSGLGAGVLLLVVSGLTGWRISRRRRRPLHAKRS